MGTYIPYDRGIFIKRLRMLRKENGYTQPSLAAYLGKSKGAIGHWEAGNREPGLGTIHDLAKLFSVSVDYMIGVSDFRKENDAIDFMLKRIKEEGFVENGLVDKQTINVMLAKLQKVNNFFDDLNNTNVANC